MFLNCCLCHKRMLAGLTSLAAVVLHWGVWKLTRLADMSVTYIGIRSLEWNRSKIPAEKYAQHLRGTYVQTDQKPNNTTNWTPRRKPQAVALLRPSCPLLGGYTQFIYGQTKRTVDQVTIISTLTLVIRRLPLWLNDSSANIEKRCPTGKLLPLRKSNASRVLSFTILRVHREYTTKFAKPMRILRGYTMCSVTNGSTTTNV